ncbi:unnamed protein product [Lactuca saligna]|uniref:Protein kinase domain-containing protein n=1 Tax=Lactuca saligna TaxID=75948 RepID=A0AA36DXY8_LACSI|nr:unnamed protein product [Lactuca saligna]
MDPKISDFGLAKIVKDRETEANTTRVVGTYGYMSPEYVLDGLFSIKSDVSSFGVVVLEIIRGKRNNGYYHKQEAFSLISHIYDCWALCVQEDLVDRPTMVNVVLMLGMDIGSLPDPKEPTFVVSRRRIRRLPLSAGKSKITQLTIIREEGR